MSELEALDYLRSKQAISKELYYIEAEKADRDMIYAIRRKRIGQNIRIVHDHPFFVFRKIWGKK